MKPTSPHTTAATLALLTLTVAATGGCSGGNADIDSSGVSATTGELVAAIAEVPSDVRCIQINTSDWRFNPLSVDVTPGSSQTIRIGPLNSGTYWVSGTAYSSICAEATYSNQTWVADQTQTFVEPARVTRATLTFRRLGRIDVSVDFEHCDAGDGSGDGGQLPCVTDESDAGVWRIE